MAFGRGMFVTVTGRRQRVAIPIDELQKAANRPDHAPRLRKLELASRDEGGLPRRLKARKLERRLPDVVLKIRAGGRTLVATPEQKILTSKGVRRVAQLDVGDLVMMDRSVPVGATDGDVVGAHRDPEPVPVDRIVALADEEENFEIDSGGGDFVVNGFVVRG